MEVELGRGWREIDAMGRQGGMREEREESGKGGGRMRGGGEGREGGGEGGTKGGKEGEWGI